MPSRNAGAKDVTSADRADSPQGLDQDSPIDRVYLARFTSGNEALEREVLGLFAAQVPVYLGQLQAAFTRKAWRDAAHTIKGSASAVGAWRLARFAEMAERLDVEAAETVQEGHRDQAIASLMQAGEEACRHIALVLRSAE